MKNNESMVSFLLYSYFGITEKSDEDEKINAAIQRAYLDAASHVLHIDGGNATFRETGAEKIKDAINNYPNDEKCYNDWHFGLCGSLTSLNKSVSYGIAQKWVNMTMKYLWLLGILPNKVNPEDLHIPIDSYIIVAMKGLGLKNEILKKPWSKFSDYKDYAELQSAAKSEIRKYNLYPIKWEAKAWIEVAKKRSNK